MTTENIEPVVEKVQTSQKQEFSNIISEDEELKRIAWDNVVKSSPLFHYMYNNRTATSLPVQIKKFQYISSENDKLTPLMVAVVLNNIYFVNDLLIFNVGKIDTFSKSALKYAIKTNADVKIIELLREYETIRAYPLK